MLLSAVSVLGVEQSSSEIPEGLMNNPVFLQTALHVSDDTIIHRQEHTQTVITKSGTGRTVFATVRWRGGVVPTPAQLLNVKLVVHHVTRRL